MIVFGASSFSLLWGFVAALAYTLGALLGGRLSPQQSRHYLWVISLFHGLSVIATLMAGWWFGEQLYGPDKAMRWDHKTILSVMAWLVFLVLIWGRHTRGWRGPLAVRTLYAGSAMLLLAYAGSRFVMEVLLKRGL